MLRQCLRAMLRQCLRALILCLPLAGNAAIVDFGAYTRDTLSGLEWLDLTETQNLSYEQVTLEMSSGGAYEGWRYATRAEFFDLIVNAGLTLTDPATAYSDTTPYTSFVAGPEWALSTSLIDMLGDTTYSGPNIPATSGILGDTRINTKGQTTHPIAVIRYDSIWVPGVFLGEYDNSPIDGSYLVRAVPLPSSAWLLCSSLLVLLSRRKRR